MNEAAGQGDAGCAAAITAGRMTWPAGCAARRSSTASPTSAGRTRACCRSPSTPGDRWSSSTCGAGPPPLADFLAPLPERTAAAGWSRCASWPGANTSWPATGRCSSITTWTAATTSTRSIPAWPACSITPITAPKSHGNTSVQISPLKPRRDADGRQACARGDNAYYWWVFPNLMINLYQGVMDTNLVLPLGPDRCRVSSISTSPTPRARRRRRSSQRAWRWPHQVQLEDVGICEEVQRGLRAGPSTRAASASAARQAGITSTSCWGGGSAQACILMTRVAPRVPQGAAYRQFPDPGAW